MMSQSPLHRNQQARKGKEWEKTEIIFKEKPMWKDIFPVKQQEKGFSFVLQV